MHELLSKRLEVAPACHIPDPMIAYMCLGANVVLLVFIEEYRKQAGMLLKAGRKQTKKIKSRLISLGNLRRIQEYFTVKKPPKYGELCIYNMETTRKNFSPMVQDICEWCLEPPSKYIYGLLALAYATCVDASFGPGNEIVSKFLLDGKDNLKVCDDPKQLEPLDRQEDWKELKNPLEDDILCVPEITGWNLLDGEPPLIGSTNRDSTQNVPTILPHIVPSICQMCLETISKKRFFHERRFAILKDCDHVFCYVCVRNQCSSQLPTGPVICPKCKVASVKFAASSRWVARKDKTAFFKAFDNNFADLPKQNDLLHKLMAKL